MNSLERIAASIAGKPVDRRAVAPVLGLYGARIVDCGLESYYRDPCAYVRGQRAVCETFAPDVLFGPFAHAVMGAAFGSELCFFADQPPNVRRPAIRSAHEWDRLVFPDPDVHPCLLFFREAIQALAAEYRDQIPVAAVLPLPTDLPILIMGIESWLETVLFDRVVAQRIIEQMNPFFVRLANLFLAEGASFIVTPCGFASPAVVTRDIVSSFTRPALERSLAQVKGPVVLHHVGAPLLAHLDLLTGLPNAVAFAVDQSDDIAQARRMIGAEPVLFSGPASPRLPKLTAQQVQDECCAILENRCQDARFILCNSGPDIPWHTPPEKIHAFWQAAESVAGSAAV